MTIPWIPLSKTVSLRHYDHMGFNTIWEFSVIRSESVTEYRVAYMTTDLDELVTLWSLLTRPELNPSESAKVSAWVADFVEHKHQALQSLYPRHNALPILGYDRLHKIPYLRIQFEKYT